MAMIAGMRAAFELLLQRFDPQALEELANEKKYGGGMSLSKKAKYWDFYTDFYADLMKSAQDNFQDLFGEEFARAYEEQIYRLSMARKNQ